MSMTTSDFMLRRLHEWGVRRIYGYPGDGINGILGALDRANGKIEFVQTRHEEMAAFMACAHAKFTGEVGVCLATSGPGAIHLLNGLYDAAKDNMPVMAIVGQQARNALGSHYQQEVDLISLFKDVAHNYVHMATSPAQVRTLVDQGMRIAKASRDVTCIILPNDVQEMDAVTSPPRSHGSVYTGVGYREPLVLPMSDDLKRAADILNRGERVAMLVGAGALHASEEVMDVAEKLGAGVAKALLGKAVISDELPYCTGAIGLLGTKPSYDLMMDCDTLLMVGTSFPYSEWLPKEGHAQCVQIDIKPRSLGVRYPADVPLHGDSRMTLQALLPLIERKTVKSWRQEIGSNVTKWWEVMEARAHQSAKPINPQLVCWELSSRLPDRCVITSDSGSAANWFARDIKIRPGMMASLSGGLATMLPGVPYATAAKINHPDRTVVALVGDGAMQMLGNSGLITIGNLWRSWSNPNLVVCVFNNGDLNQVTWEQRVLAGDPKFAASQDVPGFSYAKYAKLCGLGGIEVTSPDELGQAWDAALNAGRPTVLDVHTDPNVPPLPPHISFEQAKAYLTSMIKGDENWMGTLGQSMKQMMASWLPVGKV